MSRPRPLAILLWVAATTALTSAAEKPTPREAERALTAAVDEHLARSWAEAGVTPAPLADDAEYLRRASIDLAGKIPTVGEARAFLADQDPEKRRKLAERLVKGPAAATHFAATWRPLLIPEPPSNITRFVLPDFEAWLRGRFAEGVGFDVTARELLTVPIEGNAARGQFGGATNQPSPIAYYLAKGYKPEELAASTARVLLGVRIECAQCHDHPFATWKRDQFWQFAAAFAGLERSGPENAINAIAREVKGRRDLKVPGTERIVSAKFLDGTDLPAWEAGSREALAAWVASPSNPYFARAIVNRAWAQLFGVGIVDPVDDFSEANPPSHPELLDDLARRFIESGYNYPMLLRALASTRAYQLTSAGPPVSGDGPRLFDRMAIKGLTAEQWFDSLAQAVGLPPEPAIPNVRVANAGRRGTFLEKFAARDDRATDRPMSILQALTLMNGATVAEATDPDRGSTLGAVVDAPFLDPPGRVEALYLAALTRLPRPEESARMVAHLEGRDPKAALADIFWALLNGAEFSLNH